MQSLMRSVPPPAVPAAKPAFMWPVPCADEDFGDTSTTHSSVATSSSYYASSSGWTQSYQVSREDNDHATAETYVSSV
jgi:hypothetical protein